MVIGKVLQGQSDNDEATSKMIAKRIKALVRDRKLEGQGNLSLWRHSEVRLPSPRSDRRHNTPGACFSADRWL